MLRALWQPMIHGRNYSRIIFCNEDFKETIIGNIKQGLYKEVLETFSDMISSEEAEKPDQVTLSAVISACSKTRDARRGKQLHAHILRGGAEYNAFVGTALLDMYAKCGFIDCARKVFDEMPDKNTPSWNAMVAGCVANGLVDKAYGVFCDIPSKNYVSYNTMIKGFVECCRLDDALRLFGDMPERNVISWTSVVSGCFREGRVEEGLGLFWDMPQRNTVSWNAVIAGLVQNCCYDEALRVFRQMQTMDADSDSDTLASTLSACAKVNSLKQGKEIHERSVRMGGHFDVFVETALVDMYGKCGSIESAFKVFHKMDKPNTVSWNAIISSYAIHGYGKEAIEAFENMRVSGAKPDQSTFLNILNACCHSCMVDQGWRYFELMKDSYSMDRTVAHYCCMVDLLGRDGQLDAAYSLIKRMPVEPDPAIWMSLLGSCKLHTNVELAEMAVKSLTDMNYEVSAPYVILSNIYAAAGRWREVEDIRKKMQDKVVKKTPGCSWIVLDEKVHAFLSEDVLNQHKGSYKIS